MRSATVIRQKTTGFVTLWQPWSGASVGRGEGHAKLKACYVGGTMGEDLLRATGVVNTDGFGPKTGRYMFEGLWK